MIKELPVDGWNLGEYDKLEVSTINQLVRAHNKAELAATTANKGKMPTCYECEDNGVDCAPRTGRGSKQCKENRL